MGFPGRFRLLVSQAEAVPSVLAAPVDHQAVFRAACAFLSLPFLLCWVNSLGVRHLGFSTIVDPHLRLLGVS